MHKPLKITAAFRCYYCKNILEEDMPDLIERLQDAAEDATRTGRTRIPFVCPSCLVKEYPDRFMKAEK